MKIRSRISRKHRLAAGVLAVTALASTPGAAAARDFGYGMLSRTGTLAGTRPLLVVMLE